MSNFKSLKEIKLELGRFNVLVGPNATGKTNLIEFFKFLRKAIVEQTQPRMPFLEWWNYKNIVWAGMEHLPIKAGLRFDVEGYDLTYEVTLSGAGGIFRIPSEKLSIKGFLSVEREGVSVKIKHDKDFIRSNRLKIEPLLETVKPFFLKERLAKITPESLIRQDFVLLEDRELILPGGLFRGYSANYTPSRDLVLVVTRVGIDREGPILVSPVHKNKRMPPEISWSPFFPDVLQDLWMAIQNYTLLRPINLREVRAPALVRRESMLAEDASNLSNVLHTWFVDRGRLPERIEAALSALFPKMRIGFELTPDGRVFLKVYEDGLELLPPSISDGFYKVLSILAAIESKPSLLAIDEIENSLHAKTLEYLIDELRNSESTVIITTHSAIIVDIVKPEEILIAEKGPEGTVLKRIQNPEEIRKKMKELGITQSEIWLYGELK